MKELEPLKLPGKLAGFTGNVLYPNEESAVWDVNGMLIVTLTTPIIGASPVSSGYRRISNNSYKIRYTGCEWYILLP